MNGLVRTGLIILAAMLMQGRIHAMPVVEVDVDVQTGTTLQAIIPHNELTDFVESRLSDLGFGMSDTGAHYMVQLELAAEQPATESAESRITYTYDLYERDEHFAKNLLAVAGGSRISKLSEESIYSVISQSLPGFVSKTLDKFIDNYSYESIDTSSKESLVLRTQQQLKVLGYYTAIPNRKLDKLTRKAIMNYQDDHFMPITGKSSTVLLRHLEQDVELLTNCPASYERHEHRQASAGHFLPLMPCSNLPSSLAGVSTNK